MEASALVFRQPLTEAERNRSCLDRIIDVITAIFRTIISLLCNLFHICSSRHPPSQLSIQENSQGLYVLINGLRGHPVNWTDYAEMLRKEHSGADVWAPDIVQRGNCSLEKATQPIYEKIAEYVQQFPQKPICLIGFSNGARIAALLDIKLRAFSTTIKMVGIAGAFLGSDRMTQLSQYSVTKRIFSQDIIEELQTGSETNKDLIEELQKPLPEGVYREYAFYATPTDGIIPNNEASFPSLANARYHIKPGVTHLSIIRSIKESVINSCIQWMRTKIG